MTNGPTDFDRRAAALHMAIEANHGSYSPRIAAVIGDSLGWSENRGAYKVANNVITTDLTEAERAAVADDSRRLGIVLDIGGTTSPDNIQV